MLTILKSAPSVPKSELFQELAAQVEPEVDWLWHGYLAAGNVTLLISQWKTGKTTLLAVLLARLHDGFELAGQAVRTGHAAVISEESRVHWRMRGLRLDFAPRTRFFCRPFLGKPSYDEWQALIDHLAELRAEGGLDLVVIDTLSTFLPCGAENQPDALQRVLRPLERLTLAGVAVLLLHHPRKGVVSAGETARGSGALTAYADIVLELTYYRRLRREDRRRRLSAWSRHTQTPPELIIELSSDGYDYTAAPDIDEDVARTLEVVRTMLESRQQQMSRAVLRGSWPEDPKPSMTTLWRHLERGVEVGQLARNGAGHSDDPFRYTLPGVDLPWKLDVIDIAAGYMP